MYGSGMGSLSVEVSTDGGSTWSSSLSTISGNQGNAWHQGTVDLSAYNSATNAIIRFKGVTGTSYASDIAIDDVTVEEGVSCPAITSFPYTMNFDGLSPNNLSLGGCQSGDNIVGSGADCWNNASSNTNMWLARSIATSSSILPVLYPIIHRAAVTMFFLKPQVVITIPHIYTVRLWIFHH